MHLPRHTLSSQVIAPAFVNAQFAPHYEIDTKSSVEAGTKGSGSRDGAGTADHTRSPYEPGAAAATPPQCHLFACATRTGFVVAQTCPPKVVARRDFPISHGGLSSATPVGDSSILVLTGGGRVPRFAPNKVILWDESAIRVEPMPLPSGDAEVRRSQTVNPMSATGSSAADGLASAAASTVFDAGSAYGAASSVSGRSAAANTRQIPDLEGSEAGLPQIGDEVPLPDDDAIVASSASVTPSTLADSRALQHDDAASDSHMVSSVLTSSLSATTAGLADPFADDQSAAESDPPRKEERDNHPHASYDAASTNQSQPQTKPHVSETPGREVLELEFGESVTEICVRPFRITARSRSDPNGDHSVTVTGALLVVVLNTKAVLFEMGEHMDMTSGDGSSPSRRNDAQQTVNSRPWGIAHRTTIPICPGKGRNVDLVIPPGNSRFAILALAGRQTGHVQLMMLSVLSHKRSDTASAGVLASFIIAAHTAPLATLCLSWDGSYLATASERGTLLRVWHVKATVVANNAQQGRLPLSDQAQHTKPRHVLRGALHSELRRGTEQAVVLSMAFAPDDSVLAAASDKGTIHFFNLLGRPASSDGSSDSQKQRSSHESKFSVSTSAAKYLPTSLGNLASQLPSSMLPAYLKAQWSSAQFRIKLTTFAAHSSEERARRVASVKSNKGKSRLSSMTGAGGYDDLEDTVSSSNAVGGAGASRSTDGAWATLKGRVEDIRRWEPGLDEKVFLTWVQAPAPDSDVASEPANFAAARYHLVALTTSGSWYRIALRSPDSGSGSSAKGANSHESVLNMYKEESDARSGKVGRDHSPVGPSAHLEEFRTFGHQQEDSWNWS
ncbi:unnamed protein product [Parajaminaea phylloscopi]